MCLPNPCVNGGVCSPIGDFEFDCDCPDGFNGSTCEGNYDDI